VIGMVLAAGAGRRLQPWTDTLPKTLVPVVEDPEQTILDVSLANFAAVGLTDVVLVTGYKSEALAERRAGLEERHGVRLELVFNDKAEIWNNAYSLWVAREHFRRGVLLVNGDTITPVHVFQGVLDDDNPADVVIALDDVKPLAEEEMKVHLDEHGHLTHINKALDPGAAQGEYIGLTLIRPGGADALADALKATWERDPQLYYEDGFQEYADRGGAVGASPIGDVEWVEVDDHADLARAREVACRY
jgi:choline kinase